MVRVDFGCGKNKQKDFIGVDFEKFEGVDKVHDLRKAPYPFKDNSVDQVFSSHFIEHLTGEERITFFNELGRIMKKGATAQIIAPHWSHDCAYGDPTHKFPPISGWTFLYLLKSWRDVNAPHAKYTCDFDWSTAGSWDEWLNVRNQEFKIFSMQHYINSTRDIIANLVKR